MVYIDFHRLRQAGILRLLDSSKVAEDADYREFSGKIGLDWERDLDSALLALAPSGKYMLIAGRFHWPRLRSYARSAGGECYESACRLNGSTPERRISFFPLQDNLMALAVSTDQWAVRNLQGSAPAPVPDLPDAPVWVKIPGAAPRPDHGFSLAVWQVQQAPPVRRPAVTSTASPRSARSSGPTPSRSTSSARRLSTCSASTGGSATSSTSPTTTPGTASTPGCSPRRTARTSSSPRARRSTTTCCATPRCASTCAGAAGRRWSRWCSSTKRPRRSAGNRATR